MQPRLILQGEPVGAEFWLAAPDILAVKVVSAQAEGPAIAAVPRGTRVLQLMKFTADIENVIKGNIRDKRIAFFFFAKLDQNPSYYLYPGKRYIVSLRGEAGVLRSWADAVQLSVEVFSGMHNQQELPLALGPGAAIAYILLTPGSEYDVQAFGRRLASSTADYYASPGYTRMLLTRLVDQPDPILRDSACLAMAQILWFRPTCLTRAAESPDESIRELARRLLRDDSGHVEELLRHDPLALLPSPWVDNISQRLEIYADDMRPEVRNAACQYLSLAFPGRTVQHCK
jgi:hypothetical protein